MTSHSKKPTHIDGSYRFYIDANTIHAWNVGYKKLVRYFCVVLGIIAVLYAYDIYHAYTRVVSCERTTLDRYAHCTIIHRSFSKEELIAAIDVTGVQVTESNTYISTSNHKNGDEFFRYTYTLTQRQGRSSQQLIADRKADKDDFKRKLDALIALRDETQLPQRVEMTSSSFAQPHTRIRHGIYDIILMISGLFCFVIYVNNGLGVRSLIANKKDSTLTLKNNKVLFIKNIDYAEIRLIGTDHSHLLIHLLNTKKPIKLIGKDLKLHEQIKATLEQWANEARQRDNRHP